MSRFILSQSSLSNLEGVHPALVRAVRRAIEITEQDFSVIEGVRSRERQDQLYARGRTAPGTIVTWVRHSRHERQADGYGHAVDVVAYPISWADTPENRARQDAVARAMLAAAAEVGAKLRWGGNWDGDDRPHEKGETDGPHFEIIC